MCADPEEAVLFEVVAGELHGARRDGGPGGATGGRPLPELSPALVQALSPAAIASLKWPATVVAGGTTGPGAFHLAISPAVGGGLAAAIYLLCAARRTGGGARVATVVGGLGAFDSALHLLASARRERRLVAVTTPWPGVNEELRVACRLLDGIAERWTPAQAAALCGWLERKTQDAAAGAEGVTQPAVAQRLRRAGASAVGELLERYWRLVGGLPPAG